MEFTKWTTVGE